MDSILNFFPKDGDPERLLSSSISDVKLTISDLMDILQHVFTDGIGMDKCPDCEPADENILDLSFEQASKRAALHHKCVRTCTRLVQVRDAECTRQRMHAETREPVRNITEFEPPTPIFVDPAGGGGGGYQTYTEWVSQVYP